MNRASGGLLAACGSDSVVGGSSRDDSYEEGLPILEMSAPVYVELDVSGFQESRRQVWGGT